MFLQGLTVLDIMESNAKGGLSISHIAARQEVRDLLKTLRIPMVDEKIARDRRASEDEDADDAVESLKLSAANDKSPVEKELTEMAS